MQKLKFGFMNGVFSMRTQSRRQDLPEPNRLFLAHVLVVVRVQHVCPPVPELVCRRAVFSASWWILWWAEANGIRDSLSCHRSRRYHMGLADLSV